MMTTNNKNNKELLTLEKYKELKKQADIFCDFYFEDIQKNELFYDEDDNTYWVCRDTSTYTEQTYSETQITKELYDYILGGSK